MNSCPIPAVRSPGLPFPCWRGREQERFPPAASRQPVAPGHVRPLRVLSLQMLPLRLRAQAPAVADATRHGHRGRDDGATFAVWLHPPQMEWVAARRARAEATVPVSAHATRLREPRPKLRPARRAHYHRTSAARARVPWLLPCWSCLQTSCGASNARSSIYAYSCL